MIRLVCLRIYKINNEDDKRESKEKNYNRNDNPIRIFLNTPGGRVYETLAVVSAIQTSKTPVYTIATGSVMSGGFVIFISGHKRLCYKYATFLYHGVSGWMWGTIPDMKINLEEANREQEIINEIIVNKTKITKKMLEKYNGESKDWYIGVQDALKLKIVDEIL
jgi:ATP-dependent Clp protease protease subunit